MINEYRLVEMENGDFVIQCRASHKEAYWLDSERYSLITETEAMEKLKLYKERVRQFQAPYSVKRIISE